MDIIGNDLVLNNDGNVVFVFIKDKYKLIDDERILVNDVIIVDGDVFIKDLLY